MNYYKCLFPVIFKQVLSTLVLEGNYIIFFFYQRGKLYNLKNEIYKQENCISQSGVFTTYLHLILKEQFLLLLLYNHTNLHFKQQLSFL